jgi:hypothetical protein
MKTKLLLPRKFKYVGMVLSVILMSFGIANMYFEFMFEIYTPFEVQGLLDSSHPNELTDEILGGGLIISLMLLAFSKEKIEDEFVSKMRLESLLWAVYVNYTLLILAFFLVYGNSFFDVIVYNMYTILIFFIGRFNFLMYRHLQTPEID